MCSLLQIPMFVPSVTLLTAWHLTYAAVNERTWPTVLGTPVTSSPLPRHPDAPGETPRSDPNDESTAASVQEWLALADFYQWPHITTFDSWEHLFEQLLTTDLAAVSRAMRTYNAVEGARIQAAWAAVLNKVARGKRAREQRRPRGSSSSSSSSNGTEQGDGAMPPRARVNRALRRGYGVELVRGCRGQVVAAARQGQPGRVKGL